MSNKITINEDGSISGHIDMDLGISALAEVEDDSTELHKELVRQKKELGKIGVITVGGNLVGKSCFAQHVHFNKLKEEADKELHRNPPDDSESVKLLKDNINKDYKRVLKLEERLENFSVQDGQSSRRERRAQERKNKKR